MKTQYRCFLVLFSLLSSGWVFAESISLPIRDVAVHPTRSAPATALSVNRSTLSSQIQAVVKRIEVGVSQTVQQGDVLLKLDCTDYQLALETAQVAFKIAEARLNLAQSQKQRSDQLLTKQLTSQESADTAHVEAIARRGELEQAKLALKKASIESKRCIIKAPYAGIVTERMVSVGQLASIGTPLLALMETDKIELSALVKPTDLDQLKNANEIWFESQSRYPVVLLRLGGVVNTQTRNQEIRLAFSRMAPAPGTAGKLVWKDGRFYIPPRLVIKRGDRLGIFLDKSGTAQFFALDNAIPGRPVLVDLPASEKIVIANLGQLESGQALAP